MARAARKLCGQRVQPGEIFSFNGRVGEANLANGYRRGRVFVGDRIVDGEGGGVCQVVTTLFNAVVRAGLPVVEFHPHGLTVPYVPSGEDATVAYGYLDFQFRNDTPGPVILVAEGRGASVRVALYGQVPGVEAEFRHRASGAVGPYTLTIHTARLPDGETRVVTPGQGGVTVATWLTQRGRFGTRRTYLGVHTYRASPRIVEIGRGKVRG